MQNTLQYTSKPTVVDTDITNSFEPSSQARVRSTWLEIWTNYLKIKADALYSSMTARTIKANITGSTANATNVSFDQFQTALGNTQNNSNTGVLVEMTSIDISNIRLTSSSCTKWF